jgi:ABC-type Na+ transport system ATPase subunit NatA
VQLIGHPYEKHFESINAGAARGQITVSAGEISPVLGANPAQKKTAAPVGAAVF